MPSIDPEREEKPTGRPHAKVIRRTGKSKPFSFSAFVPFSLGEIWPEWHPCVPEILKKFPEKIVYSSPSGPRTAVYEPEFTTWYEDTNSTWLTYLPTVPSRFRVDVSIEKSTGSYCVKKYRGRKVISTSYGPTLKGVMIQATMMGLRADEPSSSAV